MEKKINLAYAQSKIHYSYHNDVQEIKKLHLEKLIKGFELVKDQVWYNVGVGLLDEEAIKTKKPTVKLKITSSFSNDKFAVAFEIISESLLIPENGKLTFEEYMNYTNNHRNKLLEPLLLDATSHVLNVSKMYSTIPILVDYRKSVENNIKNKSKEHK
ncbi:MAG: hypothetical protein ABF756_01035 [Liquorilactobacillus ghanensis]|uniref:hypothetical protein n=2 Tax=Liquorilactobacillus ghanensis TaxID=399370 RepID=UPI0039ED3E52